MQGLIGPLKELAEFEELCKNKKKDVGMIRVCGCVNSQKSHMMYALGDGCKYKVIACSSEAKAKQIYEEYLRYKMTAFSNWMRWQRSFRL